MDAGPWTRWARWAGSSALGDDDGRDDAALGGPDDRPVLPDDPAAFTLSPLLFTGGYLVTWAGAGLTAFGSRLPPTDSAVMRWAGTEPADGWPE